MVLPPADSEMPAEAVREAREALRQSEERFRLIVESAREYAIFMLDVGGHVISWNLGARRIKGYQASEIIGRHFSTFYPPEAIAARKPECELETALRVGSVEDEGWRLRKDGSRFWANVVITALRNAQGQHIGFAKITRDLTDRRREEEAVRRTAAAQLTESEDRFASFAEHLPGLAWIKDLEGRYTYVNGAVERAFGRLRSEIYNQTDESLFPPEVAAEFRRNDQVARRARTGIQVVEKLRGVDGVLRHSIVSKFPLLNADGKVRLIGGIAIDITERVDAENALRDADRRKNEFLATLSHELRNPLAPLSNGVRLLRPDAGDTDRERVHAMLERQLEHLVRLVDDLLDIARVSRGRVELRREPVAMSDVIADAVEAIRPLIAAGGHRLVVTTPDQPLFVDGDPVRLMQVVANLLNNAAKYTPDGGEISVSVSVDAGDAVIAVTDNGVGIPETQIANVFDIFAQVDRNLDRAQGGLGIGLALARSLVEMHGGRIDVESAGVDQGSRFTVRIPARSAPTETVDRAVSDGAAKQISPPLIPMRVLVVDDNRDGAESLVGLLGLIGFNARASFDGPTALDEAAAWLPAVILLDIGLPGMDGYEVARRIRADARLAAVRLIAVTGWGAQTDGARTMAAGFDDHWVKPVDPAKLHGLGAARRP